MRRLCFAAAMICLLAPLAVVAQWFAPDPMFGGWGASTAAESYQRGFADVVRSTGQANLMNSVAAQNLEQARTMDIENRVKWTEAYYQMRRENRAYRASKQGPRLSQEEYARIARDGLPKRLTAAQLDPITGHLAWPYVLQESQYATERDHLDKLFEARAAASSIAPNLYRDVQKYTGDLLAALKKNIKEYKTTDWITAKKFVESLAFEVRFPAG